MTSSSTTTTTTSAAAAAAAAATNAVNTWLLAWLYAYNSNLGCSLEDNAFKWQLMANSPHEFQLATYASQLPIYYPENRGTK